MYIIFNQIETVNMWELILIGMLTVFIGLVIIQFFINMLKLFVHKSIKEEKKEQNDNIEDIYNKDLLKDVNLSEEQILAVTLGIAIEYELYHSDEELTLTFDFQDKMPLWNQYR